MNNIANILVVDDDPAMRRYVRTALELESFKVDTAEHGAQALDFVQHSVPDLVLLDLLMPDMDGLQTLERLHCAHPELKVIMLSCSTEPQKIVQAMRLGALDYLSKPFEKEDIDSVIRKALQSEPTPRVAAAPSPMTDLGNGSTFVATSQAMQHVCAQAVLVANSDIPILVLGESGTGKEMLSLLIHKHSPRSQHPFVKVNCAAVPSELLESELFGYEAGAFTGATKSKPGKFELCDNGTILLDEIGEMPPELQAKLLHVLQDQTFSRLGSRTTVKVDVRIIAATNVDIQKAIANHSLREDLYYRLNGVTLRVPALRNRREEIPVLLRHFMVCMSERYARPPLPISSRLLDAALKYSWPGNTRELENFVRRYLILRDESLAIAELTGESPESAAVPLSTLPSQPEGLKSLGRSAKFEREAEAIAKALETTNWKRKDAAQMLHISYKTLLYKIRQYNIQPPMRHVS
jgi:two-component system response regulator AtoC